VRWPSPGAAEVDLPTGDTVDTGGPVRAGSLPVSVQAAGLSAPQRVRVEVLDRSASDRAGVSGLLMTVRRTDVTAADRGADSGTIRLTVDYGQFRNAYGGDWASRLSLRALPACALTVACAAGEALTSRNDVTRGVISADVPVSGQSSVVALEASASGSAGDYKASQLSASSSWHAGGSSGDFGWTYPMDTPPALGGPEPDLLLQYDVASIDGRTASTNNQTSWVGEGWDLGTDYVERRYKSCSDDVSFTPKPYDLCWETDNAVLSLGGRTVELVNDATTGVWHPRDDDGTRVERFTGAVNGDNDGEYWKVTDKDGTQYVFGLNHLPGWTTGAEETNSAWTVPVFGNDSGEPCHQSTFAASYCQQAWRWNLDYIVDPHGNASTYFYDTETNYYGRNLTASAGTKYIRNGYLKRIDYGQRSDTLFTAAAPMRVSFAVEERCADGATCGTETITSTTAKNWPDVPYDQNCNSGATCTNQYAPTFWTRKRLSTVTTQVWVSGTTWRDVNVWKLGYQFRDPGDGTSPALWLASITRTGKVGGSLTLPSVTFEGLQMDNRVDALEGIAPLKRWRLTDVYDESGGHVHVNYLPAECTRAALPTPETNTSRCFPAYWTPEGSSSPQLDWFHKYVVSQVLEDDVSGVAGVEETDYEYLGGGAWHYDDNELVPAKYRTWSQWRGYARVRVTNGAAGGTRTQNEELYFRGMNGDKLSSGTRTASVTDSEGVAIADHPALAGMTREDITYDGAGGAIVEGTIYDPWISAATATRGSTSAYTVGVGKERTRVALAAGGWRRTEEQTTFDAYGLPTQVNDLGDTSTTADDQCTRTTYARNTSLWLIEFTARVETVAVACTATASYPADAVSDELTFYDGSTTVGAAPTKGDVTLKQEVSSYSGTTPVYTQVEKSTFDAYGRELDSYDALNRKTSTGYTPSTGGPVTGSSETNALGHLTTSTLEPAWGEPTAIVDPNGKRTDVTFDPVGRMSAVWLPDRSKSGGATPNMKYTYLLRSDAPVAVTTETIRDDGTYDASYSLYDGRLRLRQTQEAAPDGGRVVSDTFYDSRGLEVKSNDDYWNSGTAGTTLLTDVADTTVPDQEVTFFDGVERETASIQKVYGVEKWRTTTAYGGDRVTVTPPQGDTPTTTLTDADGHTTELRQYTGGTASGAYDATKYAYGNSGELLSVTDPAGNVWRYAYDLRGRKIREEDPDQGTSTYTYDDGDQMLTSTDARGGTLAYAYDGLGRKTGLYDGSTSGFKRAEWTFDTLASGVVVKGRIATATRYVKNTTTGATDAYTVSVNGYDNRYQSLGATATIPASEGNLAGTYRVNTGYTASGFPSTISYPAAGGLAAETLRYGYDAYGRLTSAQTGLSTMLTGATYTPYGEPLQTTMSAATGKDLVQTYFYEDGTRRLSRVRADRSTSTTSLADYNYTYDPAGNVTKIADTPSGGPSDVQCFTYDYLRRLSRAWTATDNCAAAPSTAVLGGPAPYWQTWTYDTIGNRKSQTTYDPVSGAGTTSNYAYPSTGAARPHAVSSVTTGSTTDTFGYDATGNTTTRTGQSLTWDAEGKLATATQGGNTVSFLYDADGQRLIRRDNTTTTLYLGNTELTLTKASGAVAATRYYSAGPATAVRTSAGLFFEITDPHGTASLAVGATDLSYVQRRYLPFGELRGSAPGSWPDERGYVSGTADAATGLTHLGAREYDPKLGRFLSVDPVTDSGEPQLLNAYAYAANSPITASDPDGMWPHFHMPKWAKKALHKGGRLLGRGVRWGHSIVKRGINWGRSLVRSWARSLGRAAGRFVRASRAVYRHVKHKIHSYVRSAVKRMRPYIRRAHQIAHTLARHARPILRKAIELARPGGLKRLAAKGAVWAYGKAYDKLKVIAPHLYAGVSGCFVTFCINATYQGNHLVVYGSGGPTSSGNPFTTKNPLKLLKNFAKVYGGASVGYNTATFEEQKDTQLAVTAADGFLGANGGWGRRTDGNGNYYFGGYSVGFGWAIQRGGKVLWSKDFN